MGDKVDTVAQGGMCIDLGDGLYAETPDGLHYDHYSRETGKLPYATSSYSEAPSFSLIKDTGKRALNDFKKMRDAWASKLADSKAKRKASTPKASGTGGAEEERLPDELKGMRAGEWRRKEDGSWERVWEGPNGEKAEENVKYYPDGEVSIISTDKHSLHIDTRPNYVQEAFNDSSGWEPYSPAGDVKGRWESKTVYDGRRGEYLTILRSENGSKIILGPDGEFRSAVFGEGDDVDIIEKLTGQK
jgi:hypothetical protein